jgi:hypothetical protein
MESTLRQQLVKRRTVAKASLTRLQSFIEAGGSKVNEIKVSLDKLPSILNKFESAQDDLKCLDETDYTLYREEFENQYYQFEARFNELLHPVVEAPRCNSPGSISEHGDSVHSNISHIRLPTIALPTFESDTCSWLHFRDTFEALVNNSTLSNVQRIHYLIVSLKNEAKDLISNLQITNENFLVA